MISCRKAVLILSICIIVNIGLVNAQKYSEIQKKTICHIPITLDIPDIDVPAFQWAIFEQDPVPDFGTRVIEQLTNWYTARIEAITNPDERDEFRKTMMHNIWVDGFADIPGNKVYLYRGTLGVDYWYNTMKEGNYWFVTKTIDEKGRMLCWSLPLKTRLGTQIDLVLTEDNALDLDIIFDAALAEVPPAKIYPFFSNMIQALHDAQSMYYETEVSWTVKDHKSSSTYKVWLKKPNFARIEGYRKNKLIGTIVGDGENFWFFWEGQRPMRSREDLVQYELTKYNSYYRLDATPGAHSLWHLVSRTGCGKMASQPSYFHKCPDPLDPDIDSVIIHGKEKIGEETCDYIEISYLDHQRSRYYWLRENDKLPRKIKEITRVDYDIITEENWRDLAVNIDMPDSLFVWTPPEGWTELVDLSMASRLLAVGTPAPDFSFQTMDGALFMLSEHKGKFVLVNFWRVGCPSCREELPILAELYNKYKDDGFVVLGFNAADKEEYIRELLEEHSITYPNIHNTSEAARIIQFEQYQKKGASAVPLNYVVDRDGNIAMAWYGWDSGKTKKIEALLGE